MAGDYGLHGYCLEDGWSRSGGLSSKRAEKMQSSGLGKSVRGCASVKSFLRRSTQEKPLTLCAAYRGRLVWKSAGWIVLEGRGWLDEETVSDVVGGRADVGDAGVLLGAAQYPVRRSVHSHSALSGGQ